MQTVRVEIPEDLFVTQNNSVVTPTALLEIESPESFQYFITEYENGKGPYTFMGCLACAVCTILFFPIGAICGLW